MPPPAPAPRRFGGFLVDPAPLRLDRDFRLLWVGQAVSIMGRAITSVVLPYQVYVITGSLLSLGVLSLVQLVPILVFALGGGAVADTVDRRRLLLVTQAGLAACSLALVLLSILPTTPVLALYVVAFVAAGLASIDQPARVSALPRLVPPERLSAAIAMNALMSSTSAVIGPALGGIVLATAGIGAAYLIDVATYGAAIVALLMIAPIPPAPGATRASIRAVVEGLRFARRRREVLTTFIVDINAMVFGSPRSLYPPLALDVFRVGPAGVGLMSSAAAFGALMGALFSGRATSVRRPGRAVLMAVAVWGLAITAFGLSAFSFPLALVFLAIAGGADVVSAMLRNSIVMVLTPDALRGRVMSIHILVVTGGPQIGDAEASAVAAMVGPQLSAVSGGLLSLVGLAAVALAMPEFDRLDLRKAAAAADAEPGAAGDAQPGSAT